ncbi:MAG: methyltransferase domain-containing protein [Planctomycetota bacterium]|nr:methyltransferase domain-containing protein [Planctomycetota bacterium]
MGMERTLEPEVMDTPDEANEYDEMDHSEPNEAFVDRLVELGADGRMLDIGTGPGHIPLLVCEHLPDAMVVGVDMSKEMLAIADEHRFTSLYASRIEYREADAKDLGFPDGSFDAVYSNTLLHHIEDPRPFLSEARRVLKPGGAFLIRDLFRPETPERALELVELYAGDATPKQKELFRASLHAALTREELRAVADEAGLADAELVIDSDRHMSLQLPAR